MSDECEALHSLRTRTDIIIKKADKGSATVVMSGEDYVTEVMRQLSDSQYYEEIKDDPTEQFTDEIVHGFSE